MRRHSRSAAIRGSANLPSRNSMYIIEFIANSRAISRNTHHRRSKLETGRICTIIRSIISWTTWSCNALWNSLCPRREAKIRGKRGWFEAYSRCEENSLAPLNWKTLFGWDRIEITIGKVDDSRWWFLSPWSRSAHPRAQPSPPPSPHNA